MADNLDVTPGTGATVAADEIASVKFQRIKIVHGPDGTNDGDVSKTNGLPVQASAPAATTGNIIANAQSITASVVGFSHVSFSITGTYGSVAIAFECSIDGGTTWFAVEAVRSDSNTRETASGTISNTNRLWDAAMPSATHFRVRSTAYTSGTAAITILPSTFPAVYTPSVGSVTIGSLPASTNTLEVVGDVAQDAAVAGNPVLTGDRASTAIPTAMSADGDSVYQWADRNGARVIKNRPSATATLTNVASSATPVSLLASNTSRLGAIIFNDSTQVLYVKFGATASATSFTYKLNAGDTLELMQFPIYTGAIDGIWASANGNARITELT